MRGVWAGCTARLRSVARVASSGSGGGAGGSCIGAVGTAGDVAGLLGGVSDWVRRTHRSRTRLNNRGEPGVGVERDDGSSPYARLPCKESRITAINHPEFVLTSASLRDPAVSSHLVLSDGGVRACIENDSMER